MSKGNQVRLDELESRLAFQDDLIENLNKVVTRQDREIVQMQQQLAELEARLREFDESAAAPSQGQGFETPPHY